MERQHRPFHILVVEDSPTQAQRARLILENHGHRVTVARDGVEGYTAAMATPFDLVLSDVNMPHMDGFELCRRLKDDPRTRYIPFLIVTERDRVTDLIQALEVGADNFLTKPYGEDILRLRVDRLLNDIAAWKARTGASGGMLLPRPEELVLGFERGQIVELLMGSAQRLEQEIQAVAEVSLMLTLDRSLDEIETYVAERIWALTDAECAAILTWPGAGRAASQRIHSGDPLVVQAVGSAIYSLSYWLRAQLSGAERERDLREFPVAEVEPLADLAQQFGVASCLVAPLEERGAPVGAIVGCYGPQHRLTQEERRRMFALSCQAAVALENRRLFEASERAAAELEQAYRAVKEANKEAMFMLAAAVEARDGFTGAHLYRVQGYVEAIAVHLGLSPETVDELGYSSIMHDVGKLLIPDSVLGKPGKLTEAEWQVMRQHPEFGYRILSQKEFFATAREVALCHHERWDGAGYPRGLRGEQIPLAARITAVADIYDALTTERPYKQAWTEQEALAEILRLRGTHLDPTIVDVFRDLHQDHIIARIRQQQPA